MNIQQTDSTVVQQPQAVEEVGTTSPVQAEVRPAKPRYPYQVLRQLPDNATPAQQDSAIQATFKPEVIERSTRPDTLHIPGFGKGKDYRDVSLPQYYRESFFAKDSLLHPELTAGRYGVAGDPVPYTVRNDNVITGLLLGCFILALLSFARTGGILLRQAKDFFFAPKIGTTTVSETTGEFRFQSFLVMQTCLLLALLAFFYANDYIADTYVLSSQYQLIGIYFAVILGYVLLKMMLYSGVNWVFFESKKIGQWSQFLLFIFSIEGILLFPLVILQVYFDIGLRNTLICSLVIIILLKILSFYKCFDIFFKRTSVFLQIILYFCALEVLPLLSLGAVLVMIGNELKINY